jgi:hypothetical protein
MPTQTVGRVRAEAPRAIFTPSDALQRAAGPFARKVALVWPRPHEPYFAADAGHRHLIHIVAGGFGEDRVTFASAAEPLGSWSVRRLLAAYLPDAPLGFAEALRRLAGDDWRKQDYDQLRAFLAEGAEAAKVLRHSASITPQSLELLAALPPALRRMRIVALIAWPDLAALAARGVAWGFGPDAPAGRLAQLADRLERAGSVQSLFLKLLESFPIERFATGPVPGGDWIRPIVGPKAMREAALRFRNCLALRIPAALAGAAAYYEVVGDEPAIVEIVLSRRRNAWVFGEIRGTANEPVSNGLMAVITAYLEAHQVQAPRKVNTIVQELAEVAGWV